MFPWWSSTKIVQAVLIGQKTWLLGGGAYFPYTENFNDLLVRNHWTDFSITLQECFFCSPLPRLFWFIRKCGRQGAGLYFPTYLYTVNFKIFLSETTGPISLLLGRNVPLLTFYQDCSSYHDLSKNMAARGWGLFSLYIYIENFKNLLVRNQWTNFNITWQICFFGDPLPSLFKLSWFVKKHGP